MMTLYDQIPYLTVRIETITRSGDRMTGTGFHYGIETPDQPMLPIIVTNKHVIDNAVKIILHVSLGTENAEPIPGKFVEWTLNVVNNDGIFYHPDDAVDLAAIPSGPIFNIMGKNGFIPFFKCFRASHIPGAEEIALLNAIEDVLMVGYPIGIWDEINNMPITRRGITATQYKIDYNGKKEFVIDCACFPGSSGSPILIANNGAFTTADNNTVIGQRFQLLGVLWGGPQFTAEGRIVVRPVPTSTMPVAQSSIPSNLGYCIKASRLGELSEVILSKIGT